MTGAAREVDGSSIDLEGDGSPTATCSRLSPGRFGRCPDRAYPGRAPTDVALDELALNVKEFPGRPDNPRIVLYHSLDARRPAEDETAWCSSFVNYCVEQAGLIGTDSKWARSWHDTIGGGRDAATRSKAISSSPTLQPRDRCGRPGMSASSSERMRTAYCASAATRRTRSASSATRRSGQAGQFKYQLLSIRRG